MVLFINGLPLGVIELKNAADEDATIWTAWQQLQTYKAELPALFACNALLVISDGVEARVGTLTAGREWFKPWRTIAGETLADAHLSQMQVLLEGCLDKRRLLDLLRDFIVFEDDGSGALVKKMAGYHQFHAVQVAVEETVRALPPHAESSRVAEEQTTHHESPMQRVRIIIHRFAQIGSKRILTQARPTHPSRVPRPSFHLGVSGASDTPIRAGCHAQALSLGVRGRPQPPPFCPLPLRLLRPSASFFSAPFTGLSPCPRLQPGGASGHHHHRARFSVLLV